MIKKIINLEYVEHMARDQEKYHLYVENQLMEYIICGKPRQVLNLLLELADENFPHGQMADSNLRSMKNIFIVSSAIARHRCIIAGLDTSLANSISDQYSNRVERVDSVETVQLLLNQMLVEYAKQMEKLIEYSGNNPIVHKIISYVNSHIYQKITLHKLSEELNYSSEHLCRVFKSEMNQTISHYINCAKINEAKHLLRYTDYNLLDISIRLQYSSQSYFQNIFKSIVGITPQTFRNEKTSI